MINAGREYVPFYNRFPTSEQLQQVLQSLTDQRGPTYQMTFDAQETIIQQPNIVQRFEEIGEIPSPEAASAAAAAGITVPPPTYSTNHPGVSVDPLAALINAKILFLQAIINNLNMIAQGKKRKKRNTPDVSNRNNIIGLYFFYGNIPDFHFQGIGS